MAPPVQNSVRLSGFGELERRLKEIAREHGRRGVRQVVRPALKAAGEPVRSTAAAMSPSRRVARTMKTWFRRTRQRPNNLRIGTRSRKKLPAPADSKAARLYTVRDLADWLERGKYDKEKGGLYYPPQPYLRPAAKASTGRVTAILRRELRRRIVQAARIKKRAVRK